MKTAFDDLVKTRKHTAREIEDAYTKIERYKENIQLLMDAIQRKEELLNGYDAIIKHSEQLLPKVFKNSIPQTEEEVSNE